MNISDFTFIICSYEQKEVLDYCLKSIAYHFQDVKPKILIIENSKTEEIRDYLKFNNIPFWKNDKVSTTHSPSLSHGLGLIKTKYAIIMDSDALLIKSINYLLKMFIDNNLDLAGEYQGDRGGYKLHPRIAPYFCIVNIENLNKNNIKFHDQKKIDDSKSNGFFGHIPIQINKDETYYDCGSTFFEDCIEKGLRVGTLSGLNEYIFHTESLSWAENSKIQGYIELGKKRKEEFLNKAKAFINIDIKDKFE